MSRNVITAPGTSSKTPRCSSELQILRTRRVAMPDLRKGWPDGSLTTSHRFKRWRYGRVGALERLQALCTGAATFCKDCKRENSKPSYRTRQWTQRRPNGKR